MRLLHEAAEAYPGLTYAGLSPERLVRITAERGVDVATAVLYDRLRRSPEHGPFIARVEALSPQPQALPRLRGSVLVAPAAFFQEFPGSGGDGLLVRDVAGAFGLRTDVLPVSSTGTVTQNAALIREALASEPDGSVLLVSLSKGGADVRLALEGAPALAAKLRAWISICGLLRGSPVANELLGQPLWRRLATRLSLAALGGGYGALAELRYGPGTLLGRPFRVPPALPAISVVGFPLSSHLSPTVRQRHQRLAALGPNDGSTPLLDAILPGSLVYPVWSADHYFRVPQGARLLYQLFAYLAQTAPEAAPPASARASAPAPAPAASPEGAQHTQRAPRDQGAWKGERVPVSLGGAPDYTVPARIQSWYLACASGDLPVGGVRGIELLGQPLVLFRTESGAVRALSAHCWHMGTHLGTGAVAGEHLRCPLHRWEFDGRGLCRRTPTGPPPPGAHQVAYPAEERFGAVFVFSGPAPLFDLPRFRLAPEGELYFRPGPPVRLRSPWYALVCNGFDLQHLQTVHARGLREPAVVERPHPHALRLRYVSRVLGHSPSDRAVRWLSGDRVEVTITCWGGSIVAVESRLGRLRSTLLAGCAPVGDGSETEVRLIIGVRRKRSALLNRLHVLGSRVLFTRFLEGDARVLSGIAFRPRLPLPEGEPLLHVLRFLQDRPAAPPEILEVEDMTPARSERPAGPGPGTATPVAGQ